jgi:hypothetical protein
LIARRNILFDGLAMGKILPSAQGSFNADSATSGIPRKLF